MLELIVKLCEQPCPGSRRVNPDGQVAWIALEGERARAGPEPTDFPTSSQDLAPDWVRPFLRHLAGSTVSIRNAPSRGVFARSLQMVCGAGDGADST
jgi:hypothetical protein